MRPGCATRARAIRGPDPTHDDGGASSYPIRVRVALGDRRADVPQLRSDYLKIRRGRGFLHTTPSGRGTSALQIGQRRAAPPHRSPITDDSRYHTH